MTQCPFWPDPDDFGLRFKQLFVEVEAEAAAGEHGHEAVLLFAVLFDELFSESALRGDLSTVFQS